MERNPQFRRTDKAIIIAMISLLKRKPFEKITVQDILDETPVTRATFYAHFHDKYEIAEVMMNHYIQSRRKTREAITQPDPPSMEILEQRFFVDKEFSKALLKIHTETIDFRTCVAKELEQEYLESSDSPTKEIEAKIYARAYVELYVSLINDEFTEETIKDFNYIFVPVAARLLHLEWDTKFIDLMRKKIAAKVADKKVIRKKDSHSKLN